MDVKRASGAAGKQGETRTEIEERINERAEEVAAEAERIGNSSRATSEDMRLQFHGPGECRLERH